MKESSDMEQFKVIWLQPLSINKICAHFLSSSVNRFAYDTITQRPPNAYTP